MPRVDRLVGPSHADIAKETPLLTQQGKINVVTGKPHEWAAWKPS